MQASEKGQERPFLAQNSHFGHFYNIVLGQTWTTLGAHNGQVGLTFVSTDDIRPTFGNTFRKMAKTIKLVIYGPKMTIFGHKMTIFGYFEGVDV